MFGKNPQCFCAVPEIFVAAPLGRGNDLRMIFAEVSGWIAPVVALIGVALGSSLSHLFGWRTFKATLEAKDRTEWLIEFRKQAVEFVVAANGVFFLPVMDSVEFPERLHALARATAAL